MWGDGKQTRSFTYIDDCVEGILRITKSDFKEPLNLGSSEMVSMNNMMGTICQFDGGKLPIRCAGIRSVCVLPVHCADRSVSSYSHCSGLEGHDIYLTHMSQTSHLSVQAHPRA